MDILERFKAYEHKTFGDAAALYQEEFKGKNKDRLDYALRPVLEYIADVRLMDLDDDALWEYKQERSREVMAGTVAVELGAVSRVLNKAAKDWRWLPWVAVIHKVKGKKKNPYPLTRKEERKLLYRLKGDVKLISLFALNTGVRRREVFELKWTQEHEKGGIELFEFPESEGNRYRPIVLNSAAKKVVQQMEGRDPDFVFPKRDVAAPIRKAWIKAGLPNHPLIQKGISNFRLTYKHRLGLAGANHDERDTLLGLRYWRREQECAVVDLKRLEELAEKTISVKEPDLPVYYQTMASN